MEVVTSSFAFPDFRDDGLTAFQELSLPLFERLSRMRSNSVLDSPPSRFFSAGGLGSLLSCADSDFRYSLEG